MDNFSFPTGSLLTKLISVAVNEEAEQRFLIKVLKCSLMMFFVKFLNHDICKHHQFFNKQNVFEISSAKLNLNSKFYELFRL